MGKKISNCEINIDLDKLYNSSLCMNMINDRLEELNVYLSGVNIGGVQLSSAYLLDEVKNNVSNAISECDVLQTTVDVTIRIFRENDAVAGLLFYNMFVNKEDVSFGYEEEDIIDTGPVNNNEINTIKTSDGLIKITDKDNFSNLIEQQELEKIFSNTSESVEYEYYNDKTNSLGKTNDEFEFNGWEVISFEDDLE